MIVNKYANGNGGGGGTGSTITVDAALSSSSTNPVENRVITNALSEYTTNEYVESRYDECQEYTDSQVSNLEDALSAAITAATENMATQDYVDNAITAATEDLATEQYVNNAVSSASTEIYEYVDAAILTGATITVDDALSTASTNPVENRVVANALDNKAEKTNVDANTGSRYFPQWNSDGVVIGKCGNIVYKVTFTINGYPYNIIRDKNSSDLPLIYAPTSAGTKGQLLVSTGGEPVWTDNNFVTSGDVATAITAATENLATEQYVDDAIAAIPTGSTVTVDDEISTASTNPVENRVVANALDNKAEKTNVDANTDSRYFPLWNSDGVVIGKNGNIVYRVGFGINGWTYNIYRDNKNEALPSIYAPISPGTQGQILVSTGGKPVWSDNNFVTSGDVEDMIEDVVATAITIDSALSTGSTNPVQNQVITNALANFVQSTSVRTIVSCTQAQYDAMATHDPNTFYIITGVNS